MTHSVPATRGDALPRRRTSTGTKLRDRLKYTFEDIARQL